MIDSLTFVFSNNVLLTYNSFARVLALGLLLIKTHCHLTKLRVIEVDLSAYKQY